MEIRVNLALVGQGRDKQSPGNDKVQAIKDHLAPLLKSLDGSKNPVDAIADSLQAEYGERFSSPSDNGQEYQIVWDEEERRWKIVCTESNVYSVTFSDGETAETVRVDVWEGTPYELG